MSDEEIKALKEMRKALKETVLALAGLTFKIDELLEKIKEEESKQ